MPQEITRDGLGIGRHVEGRRRADLGELTRRDGADGVPARLARREAALVAALHRGFDVLHVHEVELHVLPRRDVPEAARPPVADVGESEQALLVESAERDLHAEHLRALLPLSVDAPHQAERAESIRADLATLELLAGV